LVVYAWCSAGNPLVAASVPLAGDPDRGRALAASPIRPDGV